MGHAARGRSRERACIISRHARTSEGCCCLVLVPDVTVARAVRLDTYSSPTLGGPCAAVDQRGWSQACSGGRRLRAQQATSGPTPARRSAVPCLAWQLYGSGYALPYTCDWAGQGGFGAHKGQREPAAFACGRCSLCAPDLQRKTPGLLRPRWEGETWEAPHITMSGCAQVLPATAARHAEHEE